MRYVCGMEFEDYFLENILEEIFNKREEINKSRSHWYKKLMSKLIIYITKAQVCDFIFENF